MKAAASLTAAALCLPLSAAAFTIDGSRWIRGETTFYVGIPGTSPSGATWSEAFEDAMAEWNEKTAFRFQIVNQYRDPCGGYSRNGAASDAFPSGGGDSFNGVDFGASMCGNELGKGVAAVTLIVTQGGLQGFGSISQTDIIFNTAFDWDIYTGLRRPLDFRRTALHELGHALGLGHEEIKSSIMAPRISSIDSLQADDISGANALYGGPGDCDIPDIQLGAVIDDSLSAGDCVMFQLYNGGNDTSFVDTYRLTLEKETAVAILMESSSLDSVLIVNQGDLKGKPWVADDISESNCNARFNGTLPAGEYLILANTYVEPFKCAGNTGSYRLTITEKSLVTTAQSLAGQPEGALFTGGASKDGGKSYAQSFAPADTVSVTADIHVPQEHVGKRASLFVMAILADGRRFVKTATGQFVRMTGDISTLPAYREGVTLSSQETIQILRDFRAAEVGVNGAVSVYLGYALGDSREIIHNREPIRFTIE